MPSQSPRMGDAASGSVAGPDASARASMRPATRFRSALAWAYVADGGREAITSLISLVLAALLGPEIFGLVAMALVYIIFIELLLKQGMGAAVIQRRDLQSAHRDSAFWLVMGSALVLTVASVVLSGWWATVNRTPDLQMVVLGLTPLIPLHGLTVVQEALLRRDLRFSTLALRTNLSALLGGLLGVALAVTGFGVWALVAQQLGTALVAVIVLWAVSGWRPRLRFSRQAARDLLGFSTGSLVGSLGVFVNNRSDAVLIGLLFGPVVVGLYRLASRLIDMVIGITVRALQSLSLPELSRVQQDPALFRQRLLRLIKVSGLLGVPVLGVLAGSAEATLGLIGDQWIPAAGALRLLCIAGAFRVLFGLTGPMLQALGHPHQQAALSWLVGGLSAAGFVIAGYLVRDQPLGIQLVGLASAPAVLYGLVYAVMCVALLRRSAGITVTQLLRTTAPAVTAGAAAASVGPLAWELVRGSISAPWPAFAAAVAPPALAAVLILLVGDRWFRGHAAATVRRAVGCMRPASTDPGIDG